MKANFVSTLALSETTKLSLMKSQLRLAQAQKEMVTWRHADVGRALGHRTSDTVSLRQDFTRLNGIKDSNAVAKTRLDTTQAVLEGLAADAQEFIGAMFASREADNGALVLKVEARTRLEALIGAINTSVDGAYIFSGINADVRPMESYFSDPPPASRQSVATAFFNEFGFAQTDPAASTISRTDMAAFLDGAFADLTDQPAWSANWSAASDQNIRSRISTAELVETSSNANVKALRDLVSVYTMLADLGSDGLSKEAFEAIVDKAVIKAGESIQGLTGLRANLGTVQERISSANDRMSIQIGIFQQHIASMEQVDPDAAATRVTALLTQIETSYALTARIQNLSLLNYI